MSADMKKIGDSVMYAITITTKGRFKDQSSEEQFDQIADDIYKNLWIPAQGWSRTIVAELHYDNSAVHLHGIVRFDLDHLPWRYLGYPPRYLTDRLKKVTKYAGFTKIEQITNLNGWVDYLKKDIERFRRIVNRYPVIVDDFDVLLDHLLKDNKQFDDR